jgi:hypothetical protein
VGIPFAVYPSMIYYNRDLFDEAGLEYPPHKYGEPYADGAPWTVEKLEELALKLTVDANGNDATGPDFDPENIVQFGYHTQWTNPHGQTTALFGADNIADENGNATLSDRWRRAFKWYHEGMHVKHFMPNTTYQNSDLLAAGNPFDSGNIAMAHCHLWYICCNNEVSNWDIAAVPSYDDQESVTIKLHADTFRIFKATKHPEEAVEVLLYLTGEGASDLLQIYGGFPGRKSLQGKFIADLNERFTQGVDWQVAVDGLTYPDIPNHESNLPNYAKAYDRIGPSKRCTGPSPTLPKRPATYTFEGQAYSLYKVPTEDGKVHERALFKEGREESLFISTIILPGFVTIVPTCIVFQYLGWVGTFLPLIVPHFFANAYNVFLLRQYFLTIPRELDENAQYSARPHLVQSSALLGLVVLLVLFFLAQRAFMRGIVFTGVEK